MEFLNSAPDKVEITSSMDSALHGGTHDNGCPSHCPTNSVTCVSRSIPRHCELAERQENCRFSISISACTVLHDLATGTLCHDSYWSSLGNAPRMGSCFCIFHNLCALVHPFQ